MYVRPDDSRYVYFNKTFVVKMLFMLVISLFLLAQCGHIYGLFILLCELTKADEQYIFIHGRKLFLLFCNDNCLQNTLTYDSINILKPSNVISVFFFLYIFRVKIY